MTQLFTIILLILNLQTAQTTDESTIENSTIKITTSGGGSFAWGAREELQRAFGKAKVIPAKDEVQGGNGETYQYKGLKVYFHEQDCESMLVKSPDFRVGLGGTIYKVGDNIAKLQATFPASFKNRKEGLIRIGITNKKVLTGAYVAFTYNAQGQVTSIEVAMNNS